MPPFTHVRVVVAECICFRAGVASSGLAPAELMSTNTAVGPGWLSHRAFPVQRAVNWMCTQAMIETVLPSEEPSWNE